MRIALVLVVVGCSGAFKAGPPPAQLAAKDVVAAQTRFPDATAETLEQGRKTFLASCNRCHKYPAIGAWTEAQWQQILPVMGGRAKLTADATQQTLQFVLAAHASTSVVVAPGQP